jgi:ESCRT-I complex subunit TSG101
MTHFPPPIDSRIDLLLNSARGYSQLARVKSDLLELCRQYPSLLLASGPFVKNNLTVTLLYLTGTIPSVYVRDNNVYNIPVTIYLTEAYPFEPPVVFVTPSATMMLVKSHPFVDLNSGRYINPLLQRWTVHNTLAELACQLQKEFGENPPVRARRDVTPPPPYHTTPTFTSPSSSHISLTSSPYFSTPVLPTQPQFPPGYPGISSLLPSPSQYSSSQLSVLPSTTSVTTNPMVSSQVTYNPIPSPPTPSSTKILSPSLSSASSVVNNSQANVTEPTKSQTARNDEEETLRIFLQHKVQSKLKEFFEEVTRDIEKEMTLNSTLEEESKRIEKEKVDLLLKKEQTENTISALEKQTEELQKWIEKNSASQEEVDIDQLTEPKDPLKRQLLRLQAEDLAIEDCQYALNKALEGGQIDLATHLKLTRQLAREQFFKRALIRKITTHASNIVLKTFPTTNSSSIK